MKIEEIAKVDRTNTYAIYKALATRSYPESDLQKIFREIDISQHDVMNPSLRPDKPIYGKRENSGLKSSIVSLDGAQLIDDKVLLRVEKVNRIPLALQELICNKRVSFCLANPARVLFSGVEDADADKIKLAINKIRHDNKIITHDREVAREIFTFTEVAEYWYPETLKARSKRYGFDTDKELKVAIYTRKDGYKFFPLKDEKGKLIAFSMEFKAREAGRLVTFFQIFTATEIVKMKRTAAFKWEIIEDDSAEHELGKIPVVFGWQRDPEYKNVSELIKRLEKLLSNHAEVNDYHSAPKILLKNAEKITGFGGKGESGMILQAKGDADAKYLTWEHATASVKLEIEELLKQIYAITQTPNISFENIKGMGQVSGVSIKLLFMDAHLAVKDKEGILNDFFQRRHGIICSYLAYMEPKLKPIIDEIEIETQLDPFMIADDKENAEIAQIENGNLPVKSQETTVYENGGDAEEWARIQAEAKARDLTILTEPTI